MKIKNITWAECPNCGSSDVIVQSESIIEDWVYDSEKVQCQECFNSGHTVVDEDEDAYINWE